MKLREFIELKVSELKNNGAYKDVEFISAYDVNIKKGSVLESFDQENTDLDKSVFEVTSFDSLSDKSYIPASQVSIDVMKKRKRTYDTHTFYLRFE